MTLKLPSLIVIALILLVISGCAPAAVAPTPTLYIIPTWPPTPFPTIAVPSTPSAAQVTTISEGIDTPTTVLFPSTTPITQTEQPSHTPTLSEAAADMAACTPDAQFVSDVSIPDNTPLAFGQKFTKTWKLRNTGTCDWGSGYHMVFSMGNQMGAPSSAPLPAATAGQIVNVSLNMVAPSEAGTHLGIWELIAPDGTPYGTQLHVQIVAVSVTPIPSAAATRTASATTPPATQLPASGYPAISGVTSRSREIYLAGKQRGNIPYAFAKAGDSLTATYQFLYQIGDHAETLGNHSSLAPAIDHFRAQLPDGANSFNRTSKAAAGGWDSVMLLDPARADSACNGQTPFECELTQIKPSLMLIMIGTNDAQHHLDSGLYEQNLRRMVQLSIDHSAIPVLYTIPWNMYRDPVPFNTVIANVARSYDIPLVDYYSLMEQLPNHGLGADQVHPSEPPDTNAANFASNLDYGTTVRNLVTIQLLDVLWHQVMYD